MIDLYISQIQNIGGSSVNCSIFIGSITGYFGNNCNIEIVNSCLKNQTIINSILLSSLNTTLNNMNDESLKYSLMNYLGISDINNLTNSTFQNQCNALSLVNNNISILQLNFNKCEANEPITLKFINTGEAISSCGLTSILNAFINYNSINQNSINSVKLDTMYINYIILGLFICTLIFIIIFYYKNKKKYVYIINNTRKDNTTHINILKDVYQKFNSFNGNGTY
jgi:hypothetical protein